MHKCGVVHCQTAGPSEALCPFTPSMGTGKACQQRRQARQPKCLGSAMLIQLIKGRLEKQKRCFLLFWLYLCVRCNFPRRILQWRARQARRHARAGQDNGDHGQRRPARHVVEQGR